MIRLLEQAFLIFSWCCGLFLLGSVLTLTGYLLYHGVPGLSLELIFGEADPLPALLLKQRVFDGLLPAIFGTVFLVVISVLAAVPPGIFSGIYLAEYATPRFKAAARVFVDILSGIPSIVVGLFGFSLSLFFHKTFSEKIYPCLFFSALSLAALILPYIIKTTQSALEGIPGELRQTALALGATRLQNITHVLLPEALSGILSGVVLAVGRCAEDTAVIMLTGVVASAGVPGSLFDHFEALPFYIYYISSEYASPGELQTGYSAALILLVICALLFTLSFWIKRRILREYHRI